MVSCVRNIWITQAADTQMHSPYISNPDVKPLTNVYILNVQLLRGKETKNDCTATDLQYEESIICCVEKSWVAIEPVITALSRHDGSQ